MYDIDIKNALYFIVICVVVLEILGKMACFIDSNICKQRSYMGTKPWFITPIWRTNGTTNRIILNVIMCTHVWFPVRMTTTAPKTMYVSLFA